MTTPPILPKAPRTGAAVTKWILDKMADGYTFKPDTCLMQMHLAAGLSWGHDYHPGDGHDPWAIEAFENAHYAVHTTDPDDVPAEVYVYFRSLRAGRPGHICWDPHGGAKVLTTDLPHSGQFGHFTIQQIEKTWGMQLVGYAYDLNENMVGNPPPVKPTIPDRIADPSTEEEAKRALLKDLTSIAVKNGVTRLYAARILLWGAADASRGTRKARINTARVPLEGMDDPKAASE